MTPSPALVEVARDAVQKTVGAGTCLWINGQQSCGSICCCEAAARAVLSAVRPMILEEARAAISALPPSENANGDFCDGYAEALDEAEHAIRALASPENKTETGHE